MSDLKDQILRSVVAANLSRVLVRDARDAEMAARFGTDDRVLRKATVHARAVTRVSNELIHEQRRLVEQLREADPATFGRIEAVLAATIERATGGGR